MTMEVWQYAALIGSVWAGGALGLGMRKRFHRLFPWVLSFTGAYILGITALDLLPQVFSGSDHGIGIWLLVGFLVQIVFESLSKGIEHGHIHGHGDAERFFSLQVLFGLSLHAFMEALPLGGFGTGDTGHHLFWVIILHKMPAAFALGVLMSLNGIGRLRAAAYLVFFSLMSPLGARVGSHWGGDMTMVRIFLALMIGAFFHISTLILIENDEGTHGHFPLGRLLVILAGFGMAFLAS